MDMNEDLRCEMIAALAGGSDNAVVGEDPPDPSAAELRAMTDDQKIEIAVEHLTESHLEWAGGYPYAYDWVGDTLVVAQVNNHERQIDQYTREDLVAWINDAADKLKKWEDDGSVGKYDDTNLHYALMETAI